jgi:hypothetical protein
MSTLTHNRCASTAMLANCSTLSLAPVYYQALSISHFVLAQNIYYRRGAMRSGQPVRLVRGDDE